MLELKDLTIDRKQLEENAELAFVKLSDEIWQLGSLEEIKEKVSEEVFMIHIGVNLIGNWKCDGWWFLFCEMVQIIPYTAEALDKLGLQDMKAAFERVLECFPENTKFLMDGEYVDTVNFLQSASIRVKNKRFKDISREERKIMVRKMDACIEELENITKKFWGYNDGNKEGWKCVIDYIDIQKESYKW